MTEPMTAAEFLAALKAEGVTVREHPGWRTHNRNHKGAWGPLHGVMIHHTAGLNTGQYVFDGTAELPGPLCHGYIAKDGTVHLTGWGRANHAGGGDPRVLAAVTSEAASLPKTREHEGSDGAVDGNAHFIGFECENKGDGKDPWPDAQLDAMRRASAAVARFYGWTARSVIRHMDWSDWKSDPKGVDWKVFQAGVAQLLAAKPGGKPPSAPTAPATPPRPTVSLRRLVEAARRDPSAPQGSGIHKQDVKLYERALVQLGFLDSQWADGSFGTRTREAVKTLQRHLGYTGTMADGIPGSHTTRWLGLKTGLYTKAD